MIREFISEFNTEECWGYNRFYKLENLFNDGFLTESNKVNYNFKDNIKILYKSNKLLLIMLRLINIHKIIRG